MTLEYRVAFWSIVAFLAAGYPQESSGSCGCETCAPGEPLDSSLLSEVTSAPSTSSDYNTDHATWGNEADPAMITLGNPAGYFGNDPGYETKTGTEAEVAIETPILAPLAMKLIGFTNRSAQTRQYGDGSSSSPFDDLELCFESESTDWPGLIVCVYHLKSSPLLQGHLVDSDCSSQEIWGVTEQRQGRLFYESREGCMTQNASVCQPLMNYSVARGDVIGYAGTVDDHSFASFRFKVRTHEENALAESGDPYLHWVQPAKFFYWQCFQEEGNYEPGVMTYPFACGAYQVPAEQVSIFFKYMHAVPGLGIWVAALLGVVLAWTGGRKLSPL